MVIKKKELDTIESKLLEDFAKNSPSSIPEAVSRISKDYGIRITDTPVRYWLKKGASLSQVKTGSGKSKLKSSALFSE